MKQWQRVAAIAAGLAVFIGMAGAASGQPLEKIGEWPYGPAGAVAYDGIREILFVGSGGGVILYDLSNLDAPDGRPQEQSRIAVPGIVERLYYDPLPQMLYVAAGREGLFVIDVGDALLPDPVGSFNTPGWAADVTVSAGRAYVADAGEGLQILDVSAPGEGGISFVATYPADNAYGVAVQGGHAFLADGETGLIIIDLDETRPDFPAEVGTLPVTGTAHQVEVSEPYLFVAAGSGGVRIIQLDTTDIAQSGEIGGVPGETTGYAIDVDSHNDYLYVISPDGDLTLFSGDKLPDPPLLARLTIEGEPEDIAAFGDKVFVPAGERGMGFYRTTLSGETLEISEIGVIQAARHINDIAVADPYVYLADIGNMLHVLETGDPAAPQAVDPVPLDTYGYAISVRGNFGYMIEGFTLLRVLDLSVPGSPTTLSTTPVFDYGMAIFPTDSGIFIADREFGVKVVDIDETGTPLGAPRVLDTPGLANDLFVAGNHLYVADGEAGLTIIDVSDTTATPPSWSYDLAADARSIFVADGMAYIGDSSGNLHILDVTLPEAAERLNSAGTAGSHVNDIAVSGEGFAYLALSRRGMQVLNVGNPAAIHEVAAWETGGNAEAIAVKNDEIYIADGNRGMTVLRFTPPDPPPSPAALPATGISAIRFVANWEAVQGATAYEVDVSETADFTQMEPGYGARATTDTHLAVEGLQPDTTYYYRVRAVRSGVPGTDSGTITVTTAPEFAPVGTWNLASGLTIELDSARETIYLGAASEVHAINVSEPADPEQSDALAFRTVRDLFHQEDHLYVANDEGGLRIVRADEPRGIFEVARYPSEGDPKRNINAVYVEGDRAYITESADGGVFGGISVINLSPVFDEFSPSDPWRLTGFALNGANDIRFHDGWLYVTDAEGLKILQIQTDPVLDEEIIGLFGTFTISDPAETFESVHVEGDVAYVTGSGGLRILDVSNPTRPFQMAFFETPLEAEAMHLMAGFLLLIDGDTLYVLDISDPAAPEEVSRHPLSGPAEDLTAWGPYIYIADGQNGLTVIRYQYPQVPPKGLGAAAVTDRSFVATWEMVAGAVAYRLAVSETDDFTQLLPGYEGRLVEGTWTSVEGLTHGTLYHYRVTPVYDDDSTGPVSDRVTVETAPSMEPGDLNGDGLVDLSDGIIALKVLVGVPESGLRPDYLQSGVDVDGNDRVGPAEVLYSIRAAAGLP